MWFFLSYKAGYRLMEDTNRLLIRLPHHQHHHHQIIVPRFSFFHRETIKPSWQGRRVS